MNYLIIIYILGRVLQFQAMFLLLPCVVAAIYGETSGYSFLITSIVSFVIGLIVTHKKPDNQVFFAREGFVTVALSWIVMSIVGAIPFVLNRDIPNFIDALFETVSGFTTTGASILSDVEVLSKCSLFWRSFTHWIGGMGVFVFILAVLPMAGGHNMHLMRAESPGPSVGKLVPRIKETAKILYGIYFAMTVVEIVLLLMAKMPLFDALTISFGTAGTGGFGIKNTSLMNYSGSIQWIVTVFMILFGINFNAYYYIIGKKKENAFKMEEVRWYLVIIAVCIVIIAFNIRGIFASLPDAIREAAFQVASIITTTGFSTADFDVWPQLSKTILVVIMFIGACAGSTGGGIKISRIVILFKTVKKEMAYFIHPRSVKTIKMDERALEKEIVSSVSTFLVTYVIIFGVSCFILAFDNLDMVTNFTAVAATINNIGPGLELVGPTRNYSIFSDPAKIVLMFDMLAGRLELYPLLLLFAPSTWKNN